MSWMKHIGIVLLVLFLVGCGSGSGEKQAQQNFKQGTAGLQVTFLENAPPSKLYPNSNFKIIAELHNQAAYDLEDGTIKIVGLNPQYFHLNLVEHQFDTLIGRSLTNPAGEKQFIEFDGVTGNLFQNAVQHMGPYFLKLHYRSTFEFEDTVCINPNLYAVYDSGCEVQETKSYGGQGAPVGVRSVEEITYPSAGGGSVEFRLRVGNLGRGKVKYINLLQSRMGGKEIQCEFHATDDGNNKRSITLDEKRQEALLTCRALLTDQQSYTTTLALDFSYEYERKEQHQLVLVNPANQRFI